MARKSISVPSDLGDNSIALIDSYDATTLALSKALAINRLICNFDSQNESTAQNMLEIKRSAEVVDDFLIEAKANLSALLEIARGAK